MNACSCSSVARSFTAARAWASNAKALSSGRPQPPADDGLKPLPVVPPALQARLEANAKLMESYGLQAAPAVVWCDAKSGVQMRQGLPEGELTAILGPR